uniref:2',3'-cyclic-nucleotide 3'-phosphodiesterase n=1 Tax=Schistocephalus solidus TaxID=70667 RepID=A0A183SRU5_SCHSO
LRRKHRRRRRKMGAGCCKVGGDVVKVCPLQLWGVQKISRRFHRLPDGCFTNLVDIYDKSAAAPSVDEVPPAAIGDYFVVPTQHSNSNQVASSYFPPNLLHEYVNFPFLTDEELGQWIVRSRFMIVLRGPPGSGKSYLATCIKTRYPNAEVGPRLNWWFLLSTAFKALICSADQYWYRESGGLEYRYDPLQLDDAHSFCNQNARDCATRGVSPLVIDNTNIRLWECRYYLDLARKFDYNVILVTPKTPWRFDVNALTSRNQHNVPLSIIESKVRQFEPIYPLYYGWFWAGQPSCQAEEQTLPSGTDNKMAPFPLSETEAMIASSFRSFLALLNLPTVRQQLAKMCGFSPDVEAAELATFWTSMVNPPFGGPAVTAETRSQGFPKPSRPHVTSMFCAAGKSPGSKEYAESKAVAEALLGALHTVFISGLFVSSRVVGLRIHLDENLLNLWKGEDNAVVSEAPQSTRPAGCRAHVTLALAAGVSPVETGVEVLRIVDAETDGTQNTTVIPMPDGSVHDFVLLGTRAPSPSSSPDHIYYYKFSVPRTCRVLFGAYY